MTWKVQRTESFDKWWKKESVEESNFKHFERALQEFRNITLPHNMQTCIFRNTSFECWVSRLPDKARKIGKSGGFRIIFILDLKDELLLLQGIFRRDHLSHLGQSGKHDDAYDQLIKDLTREFIKAEKNY